MTTESESDPKQRAERLTIRLPALLARRLRASSRAQGRLVSGVVREALDRYLDPRPSPLPSFVGIASSGETDLSERVEEIIAEHIDKHGRV